MFLTADELPDGTLVQGFDICIVGTGAAGIPLARRLIGSSKKVLMLSSGRPSDRGRPTGYRQSIYRGTLGPFVAKVDSIFLERSRLHMHGGTTNHFGFWSLPLDEADLKPRPGYRDASWPIDFSVLKDYYPEANQYGHFGPFNYDDVPFWERVLYARCFTPMSGDPLKGAVMRAQYDESLHDFQIQFGQELHAAPNVTVLFNANLLKIEATDDKTHVTGLACATIDEGHAGRHFRVQARAYVLAMGGVETVRVLKLSGELGNNRHDQLGRGFMTHPLVTSAAKVRFARPVEMEVRSFFRDQQVRLYASDTGGDAYQHMAAPLVNPEDMFKYCVFNAWGVLIPNAQALDARRIGNFRLILRFNNTGDEAAVNINWEQIPNENSRVMLDPARTDPVFGLPVTHLDWNLLEEDKRTLAGGLALCEEYLRKHGATDFRPTTEIGGGAEHWSFEPDEGALATGDHHMGTLRMSRSAEDGIVNADSRLHSVDNLYAAGCALFPTSGFANPALTLIALALRLADHLKAQP